MSNRSIRPLRLCLILCLMLVPTTTAVTTIRESGQFKLLIQPTNSTGTGANDFQCESDRASDYYGIGVRLGIYFSWFTGWAANSFVADDIGGALDTNAIFLFANLVAMVRCTITQVLTQLDCLILMHLSGGTVFSVQSLWGYRTCHYQEEGPKGIRHFGGFGTHLRLLLSLVVACFGLWFWLTGITGGVVQHKGDENGPCATVFTFMFAKVRAAGGVRVFYIIVCIMCIIYFGIMLLASSLASYARLAKMINLARRGKWRSTSRLHFATGLRQKQLRFIFQFLRIANFVWIVWSMILVECTLNFNHVQGVLGPGGRIFFPSQLIPMIIGAFSFVRLMYRILEKWRDPDDEPSLPQDSPISGTRQEFPRGGKIYKIFAPPTNAVHPSPAGPEDMPPEDNDMDYILVGQRPLIRYLISWLPWLSLLDCFRNESEQRKNFHDREKHSERGAPSPSSTLRGSASAPSSPTSLTARAQRQQ